jgi:hypothetical protein
VNEHGEQYPEQVTLQGKGKTMFIKVYPVKYTVNNEVFVYAENANSIVVSPTTPAPFALTAPQTPTPASPVMPLVGVVAIGMAFIILRRDR